MECRPGCGACCTAVSISSPIPGLPDGKPAGVRCPHLSADNLCLLYGKPERPSICVRFRATEEFCGSSASEALINLTLLEQWTAPQ